MGSVIGGIVGGIAGSVIPGVGTSIGASIGGALGGAIQGSSNASAATGAQVSADQAAQATQQQSLANQLKLGQEALDQTHAMYTTNTALEQPYMNAGTSALTEYQGLLNGTGTQQLSALENTPGYQFQLQQGQNAITNSASATTGVLSTAANQAQINYAEGLAGTTYNNFMDRLGGLVNTGQAATNATVGAGNTTASTSANILNNEATQSAGTAGNVSALQTQVGAAQASGLGAQNTINSGLTNNIAGVLGGLTSGSGAGITPGSAAAMSPSALQASNLAGNGSALYSALDTGGT